jgi:type IV secretory pathway VirB10-like protein
MTVRGEQTNPRHGSVHTHMIHGLEYVHALPTLEPPQALVAEAVPAQPTAAVRAAKRSRAEQSRAEQSRAEQSRAEQSRAEQSRAEQSTGGAARRKANNNHVRGVDLLRFVVAAQQKHLPRCEDLEGKEQADDLKRVWASVHEVAVE